MKKKIISIISSSLLCSSLYGFDFKVGAGLHDFIVSDIKTDGKPEHISDGTSHTFGANLSLWVTHTTKNDIHLKAKAEALLDRDKDELDNDHIPIWFDFFVDIDGKISTINPNNHLLWYIYLDNKQNTVSCIEREIRQHFGVGYRYDNSGFFAAFNAYAGFYYIEIDDDTPAARSYGRFDLDNGEASNVLEIEIGYTLNKEWRFYANTKRYSANAGFEELETDYNLLISYTGDLVNEDTSLNLEIKHAQYNFDDFNEGHDYSVLPWDNDTIVKFYATIPVSF